MYTAQLKEREWKHGENLGEFSQRILRLTTLAYPRADLTLINVLAMGFVIDSISDAEMRLKFNKLDLRILMKQSKLKLNWKHLTEQRDSKDDSNMEDKQTLSVKKLQT